MITVDFPLSVGGVAGVSTKIGCVTVPLLSSSLLGDVKPNVMVDLNALDYLTTGGKKWHMAQDFRTKSILVGAEESRD
jgi:hypothetical protein